MLERLGKLLQGKKSYVVAVLIGVVAVLQCQGIQIPEYVWSILGALGLGAVRSAINKISSK